MVNGQPTLYLQGSARDLGLQYGVLLRSQVLTRYEQALNQSAGSQALLTRQRARAWSLESHLPPAVREELDGLAEGTGLSTVTLLWLNLIAADQEAMNQENIILAAWGSATDEGETLLGWRGGVNSEPLLFRCPKAGRASLSLGWPGLGTWAGLNSAGVAVAAIPAPTADVRPDGLPIPILVQLVLDQAADLEDALRLVAQAQPAGGANILVGSTSHTAVIVERTARQMVIHRPPEGFAARGEGFADPTLALTQELFQLDTSAQDMTSALAVNHGWITPPKLLAWLRGGPGPAVLLIPEELTLCLDTPSGLSVCYRLDSELIRKSEGSSCWSVSSAASPVAD